MTISDARITALLSLKKTVTNPKSHVVSRDSHKQRNYRVESQDGQSFTLYTRQNNKMAEDFSCGLLWHMPSGDALTLVRYNGSSHSHTNKLEQSKLNFSCHIHRATERYIMAEKKAEGFAEPTNRYSTLAGALHCLVTDCNISGLLTQPEQPRLF